MKKLLLAFLLISITSFGYAQTQPTSPPPSAPPPSYSPPPPPQAYPPNNYSDTHGFRIGLEISPSLAWMKSQDNTTSGSKVGAGFGLGAMIDYNFTRHYTFSTGLFLSLAPASLTYNDTLGVKFNSQIDPKTNTPIHYPNGTTVNYHLEYIEIPLTLKLKTNEIGYVTYFGQIGVQPGVDIKAKGDIDNPTGVNNVVDGSLNKDITIVNLSLVLGAGIEYSLTTSTSAYVALNFVNGFLDATNNPSEKDLGYTSKAVLNQFALRLGVFF